MIAAVMQALLVVLLGCAVLIVCALTAALAAFVLVEFVAVLAGDDEP